MSASRPGGANRERAFGISVGTVLCVIAVALAWRGRTAFRDGRRLSAK